MKGRRVFATMALGAAALALVFAVNGHTKTTLDVNKQTVSDFYKLAFNDHNPAKAVEKYVGKTYTQHNPTVADGPQAFIDFVNGFYATNPNLHVEIKRLIAEGDLVVTHVLITTSETDRGLAAMDIFRLEGGKIVEHWDVVQPVPDKPANNNGMF